MSDSCKPMDCSLPGSSIYGTSQARILEGVAISFSRDELYSIKIKRQGQIQLSVKDLLLLGQKQCRYADYSILSRCHQVNLEIDY